MGGYTKSCTDQRFKICEGNISRILEKERWSLKIFREIKERRLDTREEAANDAEINDSEREQRYAEKYYLLKTAKYA